MIEKETSRFNKYFFTFCEVIAPLYYSSPDKYVGIEAKNMKTTFINQQSNIFPTIKQSSKPQDPKATTRNYS